MCITMEERSRGRPVPAFSLNRLFDQLVQARTQNIAQRIGCKSKWIEQPCHVNAAYVAYPYRNENYGVLNTARIYSP